MTNANADIHALRGGLGNPQAHIETLNSATATARTAAVHLGSVPEHAKMQADAQVVKHIYAKK